MVRSHKPLGSYAALTPDSGSQPFLWPTPTLPGRLDRVLKCESIHLQAAVLPQPADRSGTVGFAMRSGTTRTWVAIGVWTAVLTTGAVDLMHEMCPYRMGADSLPTDRMK